MASVNQATVIGFVGDEPKQIQTKSGKMMCTFAVATSERGYTRQDGTQAPERTDWHNIVLFGKLAEIAVQYLHKGSSVYIQGKMRTRSYEDQQQQKRFITEIEADTLQFLDKRPNNNGNGIGYNNVPVNNAYAQQAPYQQTRKDDDLPF